MTAARAAARSIARGGGYKLSRRVSGATNGGGDVDTFPRASAQTRTALVNAEAAARRVLAVPRCHLSSGNRSARGNLD